MPYGLPDFFIICSEDCCPSVVDNPLENGSVLLEEFGPLIDDDIKADEESAGASS